MKIVSIATFTAIAVASATLAPSALAGDREWAVAGKVLTGVVAAGVIAHAIDSRPCVQPAPVVCQYPPVYVALPSPVYVPAPVFVGGPQVVYYAVPAPVWVRPAPVVIYPGPAHVHHPGHPHGFRPFFCR